MQSSCWIMWSCTQIPPLAFHPVPIKNFCGWQGFQPPASWLLLSLTSFLPTFPLSLSLSPSQSLSLPAWTRFLELTSLDVFGTAALEPLVSHSSWKVHPSAPAHIHMANSYFLLPLNSQSSVPDPTSDPHYPAVLVLFHSTCHYLPCGILCSFMMFLVCLPLFWMEAPWRTKVCLFCSLMYLKHLEQCPHIVNADIYWLNG